MTAFAIWTNKHLITVGSLCGLETPFRIKPFPRGRNQLMGVDNDFHACIQDGILFGACFTNLDLTGQTFTIIGHIL